MATATIITIDGNIGAGKSTLLDKLRDIGWTIDAEPVDQWQPYLDEMYTTKANVFEFQVCVWLDRCWPRTDRSDVNTIIMERSPYFQLEVFVESNLQNGFINQRQKNVLSRSYRRSMSLWGPRVHIYLRSDPAKCLERIGRRARQSEDRISEPYIHNLHRLHEAAYARAVIEGIPVLCIDVENKDPDRIAAEIVAHLHIMGVKV